MRILHIIGAMDRGGIETWLMHVLRRIDRGRYQMDFLVHHDRRFDFTEEIEALGSRIITAPNHRDWRGYRRGFSRTLAEHGPYDVVHSHVRRFSGFVLREAARLGVPVRIAHSHSHREAEWSQSSWARRAYFALMTRWIRRHATVGLAASAPAAEDLFGKGWAADWRYRILSYGIDLEPFREPVDRRSVRGELGIPDDAFVVGHVGRLSPEKNHALLLKIAAELAPRRPEFRLLLVGGGPLRPELERSAAELGVADRVVFAGSRPDVPRTLRGAMDAFVFPSHYEGLGMALVEAQAAGLPCVSADVVPREADVVPGMVRRLPLDAGASAWAAAASEAVAPVSPWEALEAVQRSRFSIESSLEHLTSLYDSCLGTSPTRAAAAKALSRS